MSLHHLLSIADLGPGQLRALLDRAQELRPLALGGSTLRGTLQGKTVCPLFFEASTRTRS
ncbi:MAG: Aspartate/ornithine carbamoyltransferase, carbamoyl-P binding domain, partial [Pseudomonadota bacterium]